VIDQTRRARDAVIHTAFRWVISAFTWSTVMRPAVASVAIRVMAEFRSRKSIVVAVLRSPGVACIRWRTGR